MLLSTSRLARRCTGIAPNFGPLLWFGEVATTGFPAVLEPAAAAYGRTLTQREPPPFVAAQRGSSQARSHFASTVASATQRLPKTSTRIWAVQRAYGGGTLMRRLTTGIGLALSLGATVPANACERPFAWTGLYIGLNAGYSWGKASADVDIATSERTRVFRAFGLPAQTLVSDDTVPGPSGSGSRSGDVNGWLGGGHIGYNWQAQRWVYGVEADIQWTGQDGDIAACLGHSEQ